MLVNHNPTDLGSLRIMHTLLSSYTEAVTSYPLLFTLRGNGSVAELRCADAEPVWATNIKRGIVSLLQSQRPGRLMPGANFDAEEQDVAGSCVARHTVSRRGSEHVTVDKTKDLSQDCTHRPINHQFTRATDRHVLTENTDSMAKTRHYFHESSGRLDKIRFSESHSSALHGNPNERTVISTKVWKRAARDWWWCFVAS
jgi:hypothetical protein